MTQKLCHVKERKNSKVEQFIISHNLEENGVYNDSHLKILCCSTKFTFSEIRKRLSLMFKLFLTFCKINSNLY